MAQYPPPPNPDQHHYSPIYTEAPVSAHNGRVGSHQETFEQDRNTTTSYVRSDLSHDANAQFLARELHRHNTQTDQPPPQVSLPVQLYQDNQSSTYNSPTMPSTESAPEPNAKPANRLRKACDSCSIRKVKCDESGPPCRACFSLDIPCTFQRPTRRRGPPNRHAEAIKRQKLNDSSFASPYSGPPSPASPTNAAQALAALSSHTSVQGISAESICPLETLNLLIDDFFTYIHPLCPFPHEPSFRQAWERREDVTNKSFLALLASMIGALVASFPRKPRLDLQSQQKDKLFPSHMSMVRRCQHICALARGPAYLENDNISVHDAATSYFLALTGTYTKRWKQGRMYFGECLTIIRVLGFHRPTDDMVNDPGMPAHTVQDTEPQFTDNIVVQLGRRIFWTIFVGVKTLQQLGALFGQLQIPPPTATDPYPPLPVEVDDFCIFPDRIEPQPPGMLSMITGFNANVRAFCSYDAIATEEWAWQVDHKVDYGRQKLVLRDCLHRCKDATATLPSEFKLDFQAVKLGDHAHNSGLYGFNGSRDIARSLLSLHGSVDANLLQQDDQQRRSMQYEIQKANVYASSLSTRAYIVEKYWNLVEAQARSRNNQNSSSAPNSPHAVGRTPPTPAKRLAPTSGYDETEQEFAEERERIIKDLLVVLSSIDQVNMEPNGESFTMKIRSIATTLLDSPDSGRGRMDIETKEYLAAFLQILMRLEQASSASSDGNTAEEQAAEIRDWENLREYQAKFAQQGFT